MKLTNYIDFNFIYTDRVKLNANVIASACHNQYDKYDKIWQIWQIQLYSPMFSEIKISVVFYWTA